MRLFQQEQLQSLNEREYSVYKYISRHLQEVDGMNIRELSAATGVSTTIILRFCKKMGCEGYKEFKYHLHKSLESQKKQNVYLPSVVPAINYLQHMMDDQALKAQIDRSVELCMQARQVVFLGMRTSGSLGEYGARLLSDVGITAYAITDPFHSLSLNRSDMCDTVLIALSVSGETPQTISLADGYRRRGARIISITNTSQCTVAKMSEINFSYYMPLSYVSPETGSVNLITQIPVVCLLERIMNGIYEKKQTDTIYAMNE